MGPDRTETLIVPRRGRVLGWANSRLAAMAMFAATPAFAQEPGWHFSPLPGEGDRAAMGCARESTAEKYTCVVVRCEDDFAIGQHLHTSRAEGDAGEWMLTVDETLFPLTVSAPKPGEPYGGRVGGEVLALIEDLMQGAVAFIDRRPEQLLGSSPIPLSGSLRAIDQALFFCPRPPPEMQTVEPVGEAVRWLKIQMENFHG